MARLAAALSALVLLLACTSGVFARSKFLMAAEPGPLRIHRKDAAAPRAAVHVNPGQGPSENETAAELLRFVTAYGTGLESVSDVTPYAPLLETAGDANGNLHFYAFIDTWVGNESSHPILWLDNVTGQCTPRKHSDGNGWALTLDLLLWPHGGQLPVVRPRSTVTLGAGVFGAKYSLGGIGTHEGRLIQSGKAVELTKEADLTDAASHSLVYTCPNGASDIKRAAFLGYAAASAADLVGKNYSDESERTEDAQELVEGTLENFIKMEVVKVIESFEATQSVRATYDIEKVEAYVGMPVFYAGGGVFTPRRIGKDPKGDDLWWNVSYPFKPVGSVLRVDNGTLVIHLNHPCLPTEANKHLPKLMVPTDKDVFTKANALAGATVKFGAKAADAKRQLQQVKGGPLLLNVTSGWEPAGEGASQDDLDNPSRWASLLQVPDLVILHPAGHVDLARFSGSGEGVGDGDAYGSGHEEADANDEDSVGVCVVQTHRHGLLFTRHFELPTLEKGERALLQLAVTGHGWAATLEQCGEFCHAVYHLSINQQSAANVSQFRNDCKDNPIDGKYQHGTWNLRRNGWCPGTVEPGLFIDVTEWAQAGRNKLDFEVVVWSNHTSQYEPYTDFAGFAQGDAASLTVGMTVQVYGAEAVHAAQALSYARTAAEAALRDGSSEPERLLGPELAAPLLESLVELRSYRKASSHANFDFEGRAPWYLYNETAEGPPGARDHAVSIRLFDGVLVQGASRTVRTSIPRSLLPSSWDQAALHLRLDSPPGELDFDHWDRIASVGLVFPEDEQGVQVLLEPERPKRRKYWLKEESALA